MTRRKKAAAGRRPKKGQPYIARAARYDWCTPPHEIRTVVLPVLGSVTWDPCGNPDSHVPAARVNFGEDAEDDGLALLRRAVPPVCGSRIFANPTYGETWSEDRQGPKPPFWHPLSQWIEALHATGTAGGLVLALVPANVETRWFQRHIARGAAAFALPEGRIGFCRPGELEPSEQPGHASCYALFGAGHERCDAVERFVAALSPRGFVHVRRHR